MAEAAGVADRVTFLGSVGDDDLVGLYASALAVVYPPFDEDFGYVTLEAFLARKPVDDLSRLRRTERVRGRRRQRLRLRARARASWPRRSIVSLPIAAAAAAMGTPATTWRADHLGRRHRETGLLTSRRSARIATAAVKLIIQIPCLNEAATLPATLADLPRAMPGHRRGRGAGRRRRVARRHRRRRARAAASDHVVRFRRNKGLAAAFMAGIDASLKAGADFIVNTDADNQYAAHEIPHLVAPLLSGEADIVIGDRNIARAAPHVVAQAPASAAGQLGRAPGLEHQRARHDQRLPRLHPRGRAAHDDRLRVLLHARVDHPGGQEADGDRARAGRDQSAHARVAALRQRVLVHQALGRDDRADLRDVRAAEGLHLHRPGRVRRRVRVSLRFLYYFFTGRRLRRSTICSR